MQVDVGGVRGEVAVSGSDRLGDQPVLAGARGEARGLVARHPPHAHEVGAHGAQRGREVIVADGRVERLIETGDERVVLRAPLLVPERVRGIGEAGGEVCELRAAGCGRGGGRARGALLERAAQREQVADVVGVDRGDHRDARRELLDEPIRGQPAQRLAQRGAAHAESLGLLDLGEHGSGGEGSGLDLVEQRTVGELPCAHPLGDDGHDASVYTKATDRRYFPRCALFRIHRSVQCPGRLRNRIGIHLVDDGLPELHQHHADEHERTAERLQQIGQLSEEQPAEQQRGDHLGERHE